MAERAEGDQAEESETRPAAQSTTDEPRTVGAHTAAGVEQAPAEPVAAEGNEDPPTAQPNGSDTKAAEHRQASGNEPPPQEAGTTPEKLADVINFFNDRVGHLDGGGRTDPGRHWANGKLESNEVNPELRHYIPPDGYDDALAAIIADHVVVLQGGSGLGKRAGAINLLRDATSDRLVVLSTVITLKELAARTYEPGYGYLVVNRKERASSAEVDFTWRTVRDKVRESGAYLVVTTTTANGSVEAVRHVSWHRPDFRAALHAYLISEDAVDALLEGITDECSMTELSEVAQRVASGERADASLARLAEDSGQKVREWFATKRTSREILEVTALAFIEGVNNRTFDVQLARLEEIMGKHVPAATQRAKTDTDEIPVRRHDRVHEDGLIANRRVTTGTAARQVLEFRRPEYRRHVIAELWKRYESSFWDAVGEWLDQIVLTTYSSQCARGLALLAAVDFEEVENSYLLPWSRGETAWTGQTTAVYVLWWMCFAESTTPVALSTAKHWANHGDPQQRWTAAMAYSGVLGACDPTQAIRQLWHLIFQSSVGAEEACVALAMLFATLTDATDDAGKILTTLERQLERAQVRPSDARAVMRARRALIELLLIRDPRRHELAIFRYLRRYPERSELVAKLWAAAICHRGYRQAALSALWDGLHQLRHLADEPLAVAQTLGAALARSLPPGELNSFHRDLKLIDERKRDRSKAKESIALILLAVIEQYYKRAEAKEQQ